MFSSSTTERIASRRYQIVTSKKGMCFLRFFNKLSDSRWRAEGSHAKNRGPVSRCKADRTLERGCRLATFRFSHIRPDATGEARDSKDIANCIGPEESEPALTNSGCKPARFRSISKSSDGSVKKSKHCGIDLVFPLLARIYPSAETWPSGRRRSPAKGVGGKPSRGFESLRLRHLPKSINNCIKTTAYKKSGCALRSGEQQRPF